MTFTQILLIVWDTPLFIFHVSMIIMLCVQKIKRNKDLEGGFYVIFLIIGVIDMLAYVEVCLANK